MRELTTSETELVVGGNTIGRRIWFSFKSFAKFYWSERESVAERAKKNWGVKKKSAQETGVVEIEGGQEPEVI